MTTVRLINACLTNFFDSGLNISCTSPYYRVILFTIRLENAPGEWGGGLSARPLVAATAHRGLVEAELQPPPGPELSALSETGASAASEGSLKVRLAHTGARPLAPPVHKSDGAFHGSCKVRMPCRTLCSPAAVVHVLHLGACCWQREMLIVERFWRHLKQSTILQACHASQPRQACMAHACVFSVPAHGKAHGRKSD